MKTIVISTQKGGAGKTTLARNFGALAAAEGSRVLFLDLDPQKSLRQWHEIRGASEPMMPDRDPAPAEVAQTIKIAAENGFDYLIIDTPPNCDAWIGETMVHSDLVVIPVRPTPTDLRAVRDTIKLARDANAEFVFVLSQTSRSKLTEEAVRALAARGRVAPVNLAMRVAHPEADAAGLAVNEYTDKKAAEEVGAVWNFIKETLYDR